MRKKTFKYSEIIDDNGKLLFLAPGVQIDSGGMYNYILMWLKEIKKYNTKHILYIKKKINTPNVDAIKKQDFYSEINQLRINIISILGFFSPIFLVSFFFNDYKKVVENFESIHILTSQLSSYLLIKSLFRYKPNATIIYTLHDPQSHDEKRSFIAKNLKRYYLSKIFKLTTKNRNFFLHIHSERLIDDCPSYCKNIIIHPHPLPQRLFEKKEQGRFPIKFGFLGRIEQYKGLDVLFDSFKSLEKSFDAKEIEIEIVGRGSFEVEKWKNDLNFKINVINEVVSDKLFHSKMANLSCLILPYIKASQSGVGYLALAYDIPIIATNTGGLPDIISQSTSGLSTLVQPNNSVELAKAINDFIISIKNHEPS